MDSADNILGKIGKAARLRFVGIIAQNLFFLITALLIARVLGAGSLGDFILAITVFNVLGFAATLGMKYGTLRYVAYHRGKGDLPRVRGTIFSSAVIALITGAVLGAFLFFCSPWIAENVFHAPALKNSFRILAAALPLLSLSTIIISSLQGFKAIKRKVWLENFIQPAAALALTGLALAVGLGLIFIVGAWAASVTLTCLLSLIFLSAVCRYLWERGDLHFEVKTLLSFSLPLLAVGFLYYLVTRMDILMLGYFKSSSDVGIYAIAARMVILIALPLNAVNAIFEPTIAEIDGRGEGKSLLRLYKLTTPWIIVLGYPIFALLFLLADPVLSLFGRNFLGGGLVLLILGIGQLVNIGVGSAGALLSMTGHPGVVLGNSVSMVVLNFCLNCILIPPYGIYGAALATAISLAAVNLLRLGEIKMLLQIHPFSSRYAKAFLAVLLSAGLVYGSRQIISPASSPLGRVLLLLAVFCLTYPLLLLAMKFPDGQPHLWKK